MLFSPIVAVVPGLQFSPGQALYGPVVVALWVQKPLVCCSGLLCVRWLPPQSPLASQRNLNWLEPPRPMGELNSPQRSQDYRLLFPTWKNNAKQYTETMELWWLESHNIDSARRHVGLPWKGRISLLLADNLICTGLLRTVFGYDQYLISCCYCLFSQMGLVHCRLL